METIVTNGIQEDSNTLDAKELLQVLMEVKNGNFSVRLPIDRYGLNGKICDTLNDIIDLLCPKPLLTVFVMKRYSLFGGDRCAFD